ncbi:MAG: hypothetical protein QNK20_08310 [Aureibaculum sp.]|nr:hypothetical protein [Aureibaculum sp.]
MKKTIYTILSLTAILIFNACGSVKVLDTWKGDNVNSINDKNILVIARTANNQARIAFEDEIVRQLTSTGKKATASFTKFPTLNPDEEVTEEKQDMILTILKNEGFNAVVLTVIKDYQEKSETVTEGGYNTGVGYVGYYPTYYRGFHGYYHHPHSYSTYGSYVPSTTTTYNTKTYVLESVAYNLDEPEGKQLVAVVTSEIVDPSNVTKVAEEYVKAITKSLDDK